MTETERVRGTPSDRMFIVFVKLNTNHACLSVPFCFQLIYLPGTDDCCHGAVELRKESIGVFANYECTWIVRMLIDNADGYALRLILSNPSCRYRRFSINCLHTWVGAYHVLNRRGEVVP